MAERSNAAVLKTVDCNRSGGSNPSLSAKNKKIAVGYQLIQQLFYLGQEPFLFRGKITVGDWMYRCSVFNGLSSIQ